MIAIQMIATYCKKLKYRRKIVLVTDARGSMDADDSSEITKKIVADGMELVVVYVWILVFRHWLIERRTAALTLTIPSMDSKRKIKMQPRCEEPP